MDILNLKGAAIQDIICYAGRQFGLNFSFTDYTPGLLQFVIQSPLKADRVYALPLIDGNASLVLNKLDRLPGGSSYLLLEYLGADLTAPSRLMAAGRLIADTTLEQGNASATIPLQVNLGDVTIQLTVSGNV